MGLLDLVKAIDIFGHEFKFNFLGNDSVKTTGGAVLSLMFILTALAVIANSVRAIFDKSNPSIAQQTTQADGSDKIYFNRNHIWAPVLILMKQEMPSLKAKNSHKTLQSP